MHVQHGSWAPVRLTEGREWISMDELGADPDHVQQKVNATNEGCGQDWSKVNPVVRIVRVKITEIPYPHFSTPQPD